MLQNRMLLRIFPEAKIERHNSPIVSLNMHFLRLTVYQSFGNLSLQYLEELIKNCIKFAFKY